MRNSFKKIAVVCVAILPFLYLTLSFCCMGMGSAKSNTMAMASMMPSGQALQKGTTFHGDPCQSSQFQCEKLTESYSNTKLNIVFPKFTFFNSKLTLFSDTSFSAGVIPPAFFNYQSPPKVALNSLPLYLQISVLRL